MSWPVSQDYNEAIQTPHTSFADAELKQGVAVANALGIPLPRSGNFADVYEVRCPNGSRWAVKCFTRQVPGLRERYHEISKYLRQAQLPFTVDFQYLEQGIRVRGQWYPVLKMRWVEGFVLNEFVRDALDKKPILHALSQIWLRMARRLRTAKIAHCDLQHGNVLLVPGSKTTSLAVKLIDYDGMCVPALAGRASGEVGHPAYQHPERLRTAAYNPDVDRFSLLTIATALHCLALGGRSIWERYDNGDNLLFRPTDLQAPAQSPLFQELLALPDPQARALVQELYRASQGPLNAVPFVTELLPEDPAPSERVTVELVAAMGEAPTSEWDFSEDEDSPGKLIVRKRSAIGRVPNWVWGGLGGAAAVLILAFGALAGLAFLRKEPTVKNTPVARSQPQATDPQPAEAQEPPEEEPPLPSDTENDPPQQANNPLPKPSEPTQPSRQPLPRTTTVKPPPPPPPPPPKRPRKFPNKLPVPSAVALESARNRMLGTYQDDLRNNKSKRTLAARMHQDALTERNLPLRYALLSESRDLAAGSGDLTGALRAASVLGTQFAVEPVEPKCLAVERAQLAASSKVENRVLAQKTLLILDRALMDEQYEIAERLVRVARASAEKADLSASLKKAVERMAKQLSAVRKEYETVKPVAEKLEIDPSDATANLALGRFRCFTKGDWDGGLPLLAKGDDAKLRELAEKDVLDPANPASQKGAGDGWWDYAAKAVEPVKTACLRRAHFWYQECYADLDKPDQSAVKQRLGSLARQVPDLNGPWSHMDISGATITTRKTVRLLPQHMMATRQFYRRPIDVTVTAMLRGHLRITLLNGGELSLAVEGKSARVKFYSPHAADPEGIGFGPSERNVQLSPTGWQQLRVQVTETGWNVFVNNRLMFGASGSSAFRFAPSPVRIWSDDGEAEVQSVVVKRSRTETGR